MSDRLAVSLLALAGLAGCARLEPPPAEAPWFRHTPPADSSGGGITLAPARRGHAGAPAVARAEAPAAVPEPLPASGVVPLDADLTRPAAAGRLDRLGPDLRGTLGGASVHLREHSGAVTGTVGGEPALLHRSGQALRGEIGGQRTHLVDLGTVSTGRIGDQIVILHH